MNTSKKLNAFALDTKEKMGQKIALLRNEKGLTIKQLSIATGISEATISRVENNQGSLNAHFLILLANALEIEIGELFQDKIPELKTGRRVICRQGEGVHGQAQSFNYEILCSELSSKKMLPAINHITAQSLEETRGLIRHPGEEFIYVIKGRVKIVTEYYEPAILKEKDSIYIDSSMGHSYLAMDNKPADILVVGSQYVNPSKQSDKA